MESLMAALETFRGLDPDMPMAMALSLLVISKNEGLSLKELAEKVGIGMASVSRYVAFFGKPNASGKKGLGLVVAVEDPLERRKKTITLTAKGRAVIAKLEAA
jgi:DNA-binding MarR family transcriptional regulator